MKLEYRPAGQGATWTVLANDATGSIISGFAPQMQSQPAVSLYLRSLTPRVHDRITARIWTATCTVDRVHADEHTAMEYRATHPAELPALIDLRCTSGTKVTYLIRAHLDALAAPVPDGKSTLFSYQWTAENYTVNAP